MTRFVQTLSFLSYTPIDFFHHSLSSLPHSSHLEVVNLHEGFVRVEGMFNCGGARLADLTGVLHVRPASRQIEQTHTHTQR